MNTSLIKTVEEYRPWLISLRRDFHRFPEIRWEEVQTTEKLTGYLQQFGYETDSLHIPGHNTGVTGILHNGEGPALTLRFDIDALAVTESTAPEHLPQKEGFISVRPGYMHACGHDGHMSIGLGTARILSEQKDHWAGTIRFIFQPAEEGCQGALPIVETGLLDDTDYFLAGHIVPRNAYPDLDGDFVCAKGSLATTKLDAVFTGQAAHGAHPEDGRNVIQAISSAITALYGIPRHSEGASFVNVGKVTAGSARNVVAGYGLIQLEVRGETTKINDYMTTAAKRILSSCAAMQEVNLKLKTVGSAPSLDSTKKLTDSLHDLFSDPALPVRSSSAKTASFFASEDAAHMLEAVKAHGGEAAYLLLFADAAASLHQSSYTFDENVLVKGVLLYSLAACSLLKH